MDLSNLTDDHRTTATIKRAFTQWFVVVAGTRGGVAMASKKAAEEYCFARNYRVVTEG